MEKIVFLFCLFAAGSAVFFPFINLPNRQQMMNICIYSVNPARYQPKCFMCPSSIYQNVLRTCLNAAAIPSNISYTNAACLEQNCAIGRGKRSVDLHQPDNALEGYESREPVDLLEPARVESGQQSPESTPVTQSPVETVEFVAADENDYDYASDISEMDEQT